MSKHAKIVVITALLGFAFAISGITTSASAAEPAGPVSIKVVDNATKPAVNFPHKAHNAKGYTKDCTTCHTSAEGGKGTIKPEYKVAGFANPFHKTCKGCHEAKAAGPKACGECHK